MSKGGGILSAIEKPFQDVGKLITDPSLKSLENVGHDVANIGENVLAYQVGGPIGVGALNAGKTAISGGGIGDSLKSAALSTALSYGGQQLGSAASSEFPETMNAIKGAIPDLGIGSTASSIGTGISDAFKSATDSLGFTSATPTTEAGIGSSGTSAGGTPISTQAAPTGGGTGAGAAGGAAPAGVDIGGTGDVTSQFSQALGGPPSLSSTGAGTSMSPSELASSSFSPDSGGSALDSPVGTSSTTSGGANVGSQDLSNFASGSSNPSGFQGVTPGDLGSSVATPSFATSITDALGFTGGAPSAADIASNNATFASMNEGLPSNISSASGNAGSYFDNTAGGNAGAGSNLPTATPTSASSLSEIMGDPTSLKGYEDLISRNPGALLTGGGLALDALRQGGVVGNNTPKGQKQVEQIAAAENTQGQQLAGYLQSGTLPPGMQAGIDKMANDAKAAIRSRYASMGMSNSSSEQTELAAIDTQAQAQAAQIAQQLLTTGINETGLAAGLYTNLMNSSLAQDAELGTAFGNFASAFSGGSGSKAHSTTSG